MSFNKHFPDAPIEHHDADASLVWRARLLRYFWLVSSGMLIAGYVLMVLAWTGGA